tara:strand:- start:10168 stop:10590 length:423 start_codon:yes stop_codon:yes gene_type:complete
MPIIYEMANKKITMKLPENLKYSKEHTWIKVTDSIGTVGITDFAQKELGEIVYVDLPNVGDEFDQNEVFGSVEALKTVSDLFIPIKGEIIEIQEALNDTPKAVNDTPYSDGWMIKIKIDNTEELNTLLTAEEYQNFIEKN